MPVQLKTTSREMSDCNLAMNNAMRKACGFHDWRSIREIRDLYGVQSLYVIFKKTQDLFKQKCLSHPNPIVSRLARLD